MFGFFKQEKLMQGARVYIREEGFELEHLPASVRQGFVDAVKRCVKKGGNEYDVVIKICLDMVSFLDAKGDGSIFEVTFGNKVSWVNRAISVSERTSGKCQSEQTEAFSLMSAFILMNEGGEG